MNDPKQTSELEVFPLSYGQEALYFIHSMDTSNYAYHISISIRICSELNIQILQDALQRLIQRHSGLRTVFLNDEKGQLRQRVMDGSNFSIKEIDASNWDEDRLKKEVNGAHQCPFDLEEGPLIRAHLFKTAKKSFVLLVTFHHIIFDGWSFWVIFQELQEVYSALVKGKEPELTPLEADYADFVFEQSALHNSSQGKLNRSFWKDRLPDPLPVLNLNTDYPRPANQTFNGATYSFSLNQTITKNIKQLAKKEGVTAFTLLLTVYQILLYRYTNQDNILVACPTSLRRKRKYKHLCGFFVNQIIVAANFEQNLPFTDFLAKTGKNLRESLRHQGYPFPQLVKDLQPERDLSRPPIAQLGFVFQKPQEFHGLEQILSGKRIKWGCLDIEQYKIGQREGLNELDLEIIDADSYLSCELKYKSDLFYHHSIQRFAANYQSLLNEIINSPGLKIGEYSLLSHQERNQIVLKWNSNTLEYPKSRCFHQLFEASVERFPEKTALVCGDKKLSYAELNAQANQIAHYLKHMGAGPETLVAIFLPRSIEMIIGLLGILKSGSAYLAMDTSFPIQRLSQIINNAQPLAILTLANIQESLPAGKAKVLCLDTQCEVIRQESTLNPLNIAKDRNMAYVVYTSGSTGMPKGVVIEQKAILNYLHGFNATTKIKPGKNFALVSFLSADFGNTIIFSALISGGCIHILTQDQLIDAKAFSDYMRSQHIDYLKIVPSHLSSLLRTAPDGVSVLPKTALILGGEISGMDLIKRLNIPPELDVYNHYGPSETTIGVLMHKYVKDDVENKWQSLPIGRPLPNTQVYILDHHLNPVPIGVPGEIYIGGESLARCYLNQAKETQKNFIPNPMTSQADSKLYRTGDRACFLPDGNIQFLGRFDFQIKIRGYRIEPGEIETILAAHSQISEVVVMAVEIKGSRRLTAYFTFLSDIAPRTDELRAYLRKKVPDYMIPAFFIPLTALPPSSHGKINRSKLPLPDIGNAHSIKDLKPETETEKAVVEIWSKVLHLATVGVEDNFFEIGGDSLLIMQVIARLNSKFNIDLSVHNMFEKPSIRAISNLIVLKQLETVENQALEDMLSQIESMSEDDVIKTLNDQ